MARIRDFAVTEQGSTTSTSIVCNMPEHVAGDVLIHFSSKDGAVAINATAGWTNIQDGLTAGCAYRSEFKSAASSAETLTLVTGTAENWTVVVVSIEGADGSSLANLIADSGGATAESGADDTAMPFAGPSDTTNTDANCLILHAWFSDSGLSPTAYAPLTNVYAGDNGANSVGVAYTYQRTAGSITAANWFGRANDDGRGIVLAIKDTSSDAKVPGYSDAAVSNGQVLKTMVGLATTESDSWPVALTIPTIGDDFDYVQRDVSGAFTDFTAATNNTTASDVTFGTAVGDIMYFGGTERFQAVVLNVATAGVAGVLAWEYYNGSSWVSTGVTGSSLLATGQTLITWSTAAVAAMTSTTINSQTYFWIRARVTTLYTTAIVLTQGRKGGRTATYSAATASGDNGTNPYTDGASHAGSSTTTTLSGFEHQYGTALDMDTGLIYGTFRAALRRDLDIDPSFPMPVSDPGGLQVTFLDSSANYASYIIQARGAKDVDPDGRNVFALDWNGAATAWALRGAVNKSSVTRSIWTSLAQAGAVARVYSMLNLVTRLSVAGGSSTEPLDFDDVVYVVNNSCGLFPFIKQSGAAATSYVPLQFGGGDKLCLSVDKVTLQFPRVYDGVDYFTWNAAANVAGVKFYPKSTDVCKWTNCLFTSPSPYRWEFDSAMSGSATIDFTGSTVVGATVTLQSALTLDQVSFISCPTFTLNAATLTNCSFTGTTVAAASPGAADNISDSSFTSSGTGHGMTITGTAADMTLDGVTFTGYAASNGSTGNEAIYVNIASGSMTISITGGGSTPSIRTAGATVTVVNAVTVKVTAKDADTSAAIQSARVLLYASTGTTVTITRSGSTATVTHTAHGKANGDKVIISGADQGEYNGVKTISNVTTNTYDYTVSGTPTTPATGTITSYRVILDGTTDASGILQNTAFAYTTDIAVTGRVRKGSAATFYKTSPLSGTITTAGLDLTAFLVKDT
jgi:hypothetical protein